MEMLLNGFLELIRNINDVMTWLLLTKKKAPADSAGAFNNEENLR